MITLFGVVWLIIIIYSVTRNNLKSIFFWTLLFMTFQSSNVIVINGNGIGSGVLTTLVLVLKIFVFQKGVLYKIKYGKLVYSSAVVLFFVALFSVIYNGVFESKFILLMQLLAYVLCFISFQFIRASITANDIYIIVRKIIVFHVWFSIIQLLATTEILPIKELLRVMFYNDPSTDVVFHKLHYARMMSTFMEPSYFAGFIVGALFFLLYQKDKWNKNIFLMGMVVLEILMTKSSTAYGALLIMAIIFVVGSKNLTLSQKMLICGLGIIGYVVMYFGFYSILDAVVFSKDTTGSFSTRRRFNNTALSCYIQSPVIGIGYKNCRGSSFIYSLLGQLGIIGVLMYSIFNICIVWYTRKYSKSLNLFHGNIMKGVTMGVATTVLCQIISCPDLDLCTYWMWLFVYSMTLLSLKEKEKINE